jgi:hypothetical protein
MAKAKHAPLYYATYKGPEPVAYVGERGYVAGQTVQIGKEDAALVRRQKEHDFDVERVTDVLIGTAEEIQPDDPAGAHALHQKLAKLGG